VNLRQLRRQMVAEQTHSLLIRAKFMGLNQHK